jgi:predicted metal-dependent enzyme (double-stranded beta helix superfamily)
MAETLESFAAACRDVLHADDTPRGRQRIADRLQAALAQPAFVAAQFAGPTSERHVLYEDPQLGFCILAHDYAGPKESRPHDHGPSWAIYGQAAGETSMSDYAVLEPASAEAAGKVRRTRTYSLSPGDVHVYNEGDVHSPSRAGPTRLIRIEGVNMERVQRLKFEVVGAAPA